MKKLMYLLVVGVMFAFTACDGGEATETAETPETVVETVDVCATTGEACLEDHSCCAVEEATTHSHEDGTEHSHEGDDEGHTHDEGTDEESAE